MDLTPAAALAVACRLEDPFAWAFSYCRLELEIAAEASTSPTVISVLSSAHVAS